MDRAGKSHQWCNHQLEFGFLQVLSECFGAGASMQHPPSRLSLDVLGMHDTVSKATFDQNVFRRSVLHDSKLTIDDPRVREAWDALAVSANSPDDNSIKRDMCGALVRFEHYGLSDSEFGWTVRWSYRFDLWKMTKVHFLRASHVCNCKPGELFVCAVTSSHDSNIEWELNSPLSFFPR